MIEFVAGSIFPLRRIRLWNDIVGSQRRELTFRQAPYIQTMPADTEFACGVWSRLPSLFPASSPRRAVRKLTQDQARTSQGCGQNKGDPDLHQPGYPAQTTPSSGTNVEPYGELGKIDICDTRILPLTGQREQRIFLSDTRRATCSFQQAHERLSLLPRREHQKPLHMCPFTCVPCLARAGQANRRSRAPRAQEKKRQVKAGDPNTRGDTEH